MEENIDFSKHLWSWKARSRFNIKAAAAASVALQKLLGRQPPHVTFEIVLAGQT